MTNLPPVPRRIRATHSLPGLRLFGRLFLAVVFAGTLVLVLALGNELALRWLGREVTAAVSAAHERPGKSGGPYEYTVEYTYTSPGGGVRSERSRISSSEYRRLADSAPGHVLGSADVAFPGSAPGSMAVRAYAIGPWAYGRPVEHAWGSMWLLIPAIFAPLAMMLSFVLYLAIVVRPGRYRRLFSHGVAVPGTIVDKVEQSDSESVEWMIAYVFRPVETDEELSGSATVPSRWLFEQASKGEAVTVLYDPERPTRSAVYEYGGFACE